MDKKEYFDMLFNIGLFINPMLEYNDNILLQARKFDDEFMDLENFYDITKDIFYLNSLNENGKNKYEEFIEDEFYKKMNLNLDDEIDNKIKKELLPFLCIRYDAKKNKRKLDFSPEYIFVKLLLFLNIKLNENDLNGNVNNYYKGCKRELKNKIEILRRVMNKDKASTNDYKIIRELYGFDISKEKDISKKDMYLLKTIYLTMKKIKNTMQAYQNNSKDFNIFNFIACFDLEKLYLVFSKCVLDYANEIYKLLPQEPIAAITEPLSYVSNTISDLGKDYNTSIKCYDLENNCFYDYDFQTLKKELEEYCSLFNTKIKRLTVEEIKMQGIKKAKEASDYIKEKENLELDTLKASWKFMEKGKRKNSSVKKEQLEVKGTYNKTKKDNDYYAEKLEERLDVFENTNYLYKIIGMDKFDGYVGFIYADGTVLFEKFFEVTKNKTTGEEEKRPCKLSNATYKMNIYNFAQFSKLTKQEIIEYIKNIGNEELERFYHSKNWSNNIKKRAEAYSKKSNLDIYNEISSLIDKGDLTKNHI